MLRAVGWAVLGWSLCGVHWAPICKAGAECLVGLRCWHKRVRLLLFCDWGRRRGA